MSSVSQEKKPISSIGAEIKRLNELVSEGEKKRNPTLMKKLEKLKLRALAICENAMPVRLKFAGAL